MAEFDLLILGGGTGGYVAALRAAQLGMKVGVAEKNKLGGTCLHRGCIPSKSFLRSAEVYHEMQQAESFGLKATEVGVHFPGVVARKDKIVGNLHKGVQGLLKRAGVTVLHGTGTLMAPSIFAPSGWVSVSLEDGETEKVEAQAIIVATGSCPRTLGIPIDGRHTFTSDEILAHEALPGRMVILGGGAIGMEWASLYSDFGVQVTVLEALPRILTGEEPEIADEIAKLFKRRRVQIITGVKVLTDSVTTADGEVSISYELDGQREIVTADALLVSAGRECNIHGIGLESFERIRVEQGRIQVDEFQRTGQPGIYAIGDVVGGGLAHVAAHQGLIAVEHIAGHQPYPLDRARVPRCVYTRPEVASVGLTEEEAHRSGREVKVGKFPFRSIGKAQVFGEIDGFAKLVTDAQSGELLGAHLVGPHVTELISEAGLARLLNATAWEITIAVHPHPTLSEIFGEAALAVEGRALHS